MGGLILVQSEDVAEADGPILAMKVISDFFSEVKAGNGKDQRGDPAENGQLVGSSEKRTETKYEKTPTAMDIVLSTPNFFFLIVSLNTPCKSIFVRAFVRLLGWSVEKCHFPFYFPCS